MADYTESQIRELSGRELRVAVHRLVLEDDLTANTDERRARRVADEIGRFGAYGDPEEINTFYRNWRAEPLEMPLSELMEAMPPRFLLFWTGSDYGIEDGRLPSEGMFPFIPVVYGPDMRTALERAACIVKLREGE